MLRRRGKYAERTLRRAEEWIDATIPNAEVIGIQQRIGVVVLTLRLIDGHFAGRTINMNLDWPPTARSAGRWAELFDAAGIAAVPTDSTRLSTLHTCRFAVQLLVRAGTRLGLGRIYPARLPAAGP